MKVLLVDDSEQTTNSVAAMMGRRNIGEVRVAYKGDDAVRVAAEFKPDVVVLDIDLPVLNGFEVLEEFKKRAIDTRVIMVSGVYTDTEHVVRCIKAGACDFLKKPTDVDTIINSARRHFLLENTDNLSLYSQAPGLIKQLIDRADEEERLARNSEVKKLVGRANKAEQELQQLKAKNEEAKIDEGKLKVWWNKISPNERAAYIGLIGACIGGSFAFAIAMYNKAPSHKQIKPDASELLHPTPNTSPQNTTGTPSATVSLNAMPSTSAPHPNDPPASVPLATPRPNALGLTFEQYYDKIKSFGGRLGLRRDYLDSVDGTFTTWQGVVANASVVSSDLGFVSIGSEKAPNSYDVVTVAFDHLTPEVKDRIHSLETGDVVQISGLLITKREAAMDAETLVIIRPVEKPVSPRP